MSAEQKHILCIDDEPDVLSVAQMSLETVGEFKVTAVSSGKQGIEAAANEKPDVILLDVMMPEMDGPTALKELRQNTALSDVPIIFMTARVRQSEIEEYMAMGANGVIAKPFDPMTLSTQVNELWKKFNAK